MRSEGRHERSGAVHRCVAEGEGLGRLQHSEADPANDHLTKPADPGQVQRILKEVPVRVRMRD
jgi:hypothetical protein